MRKIHPYDVYSKYKNSKLVDTGERVDIPVFTHHGEFLYNAQGHVMLLDGERIIETSTVIPETMELI